MSVVVTNQMGNFPDGFCFENPQQFANAMVALITSFISGNFNGLIISPSEPAVQDQDKLWLKTDSSGRPIGFYSFLGQWLWPNPIPVNSPERRIWTGSESSVWSYDGGDGTDPGSNPPTIVSGAMWKVDHDFDFRFPIGAGQNSVIYTPPGTNSSISVGQNVDNNGNPGEERHILTDTEIAHIHEMLAQVTLSGQAGDPTSGAPSVPPTASNFLPWWIKHTGDDATMFSAHGTATAPTVASTSDVNGAAPVITRVSHQNMPPFHGVFFIQRTARQFYTAS